MRTPGNTVTVIWCLFLEGKLLPASSPDALWDPTSCFTLVQCEWCGALTSVLILRMHGSTPPLQSDSSGIVPSVQSVHNQYLLNQHFILKVFSHICWQEIKWNWNTAEISTVISKLMIHILQSRFILRCKRSNSIQ